MTGDVFFINLALGGDGEAARNDLFDIVEKWFAGFDKQIERRSGRSNESTPFVNNSTFSRFLESTDECSFYAGESEEGTDLECLNWQVFSNLNFENHSLIFAVNKGITDTGERELLNRVLSEAVNLPVVYGYAFSNDKTTGLGYSMGVVFFDLDDGGDRSDELAEKVARWNDALDDGTYPEKLRNVYPYNLLKPDFRDWVERNGIGIIEKAGNLDLWKPTGDEMTRALELLTKEDMIWEI